MCEEKTKGDPGEGQGRFLPYRQFSGYVIPNCLSRYPDLSSTAKLVWGRLAQYAGRNGNCFPAYQTLADELGCRRNTVIKAVQSLVDRGFLERESRPGRSTLFHFLFHPIFRPGAETAPPAHLPGAETAPPPGAETAPPTWGGNRPTKRIKDEKKEENQAHAHAHAIPEGATGRSCGSDPLGRRRSPQRGEASAQAMLERQRLLQRQAMELQTRA